jgi:2-C-methyl-D-erythritol 4-phosphate cytidylyltransferase
MHLLIPAAGMGRRMGSDRNKLLLTLLAEPLLAWTLKSAAAASEITWIGILCQPDDWDEFKQIVSQLHIAKPVNFIQGGDTRQQSVCNGVLALPENAEYVLIHDGARCLATPALFDRCADATRQAATTQGAGTIAAIPVKDTIKVVDSQTMVITDTPDRRHLWAAQTPQGFSVRAIQQCHRQGQSQGWNVTDDAALFERCGLPVVIVPGEETNLKVTTPMDLTIAEHILRQRLQP